MAFLPIRVLEVSLKVFDLLKILFAFQELTICGGLSNLALHLTIHLRTVYYLQSKHREAQVSVFPEEDGFVAGSLIRTSLN